MDHIEYLFAGFAVFWAGLFIYLLALQTRLRSLLREVERLEERLAESEGTSEGTPARVTSSNRSASSLPGAPAPSSES